MSWKCIPLQSKLEMTTVPHSPFVVLVGDLEPQISHPSVRLYCILPACLVYGTYTSRSILKLHSHIIRLLSGYRVELIFYPSPHPAILFTFSIGKTWSRERFISVLVRECGIPDIRKSEGKVCIWMAVRRSGKSSQKS